VIVLLGVPSLVKNKVNDVVVDGVFVNEAKVAFAFNVAVTKVPFARLITGADPVFPKAYNVSETEPVAAKLPVTVKFPPTVVFPETFNVPPIVVLPVIFVVPTTCKLEVAFAVPIPILLETNALPMMSAAALGVAVPIPTRLLSATTRVLP